MWKISIFDETLQILYPFATSSNIQFLRSKSTSNPDFYGAVRRSNVAVEIIIYSTLTQCNNTSYFYRNNDKYSSFTVRRHYHNIKIKRYPIKYTSMYTIEYERTFHFCFSRSSYSLYSKRKRKLQEKIVMYMSKYIFCKYKLHMLRVNVMLMIVRDIKLIEETAQMILIAK